MISMLKKLVYLSLLVVSSTTWAHKPSDSYLTLHANAADSRIQGQWDIAVRDLELIIDLDDNHDGSVTWGELRSHERDLLQYAFARLRLTADGESCVIAPGGLMVDDHSDGAYAVLNFGATCNATPHQLQVGYTLLFDLDPSHRGLLRIDADGVSTSAVLGPDATPPTFNLAEQSLMSTFLQFVGDGIHHIWIGYDHIAFLISLLLPAVLVRRDRRWIPIGTLRSALLSVVAVVTAFTISHSITLTLAALGIIGLPSRLVESGIALSVLLAALNNIWPLVTRRVWIIAFAFGLVHGFGFASVLADLGLPRDALALSLAGFNVGVEIGQLSIVLLVVPLIFLLRERRLYRPAILVGGSASIAVAASIWLVGRAFDLGLG